MSLWRKTFQLLVLWDQLCGAQRSGESHENPHRGETVQLLVLWQKLHSKRRSEETHDGSHRRETIQLSSVWQKLLSKSKPDVPFLRAHGTETVQLQRLWPKVHVAVAGQKPQVCRWEQQHQLIHWWAATNIRDQILYLTSVVNEYKISAVIFALQPMSLSRLNGITILLLCLMIWNKETEQSETSGAVSCWLHSCRCRMCSWLYGVEESTLFTLFTLFTLAQHSGEQRPPEKFRTVLNYE